MFITIQSRKKEDLRGIIKVSVFVLLNSDFFFVWFVVIHKSNNKKRKVHKKKKIEVLKITSK